jgi:hypothetical protein
MPDILTNLQKLPERCYLLTAGKPGMFSTDAPIVALVRGEPGYYPIHGPAEGAAERVQRLNANRGASPQQVAAMLAGSMFGWHVPAADADLYDEAGNPIAEPVRECQECEGLGEVVTGQAADGCLHTKPCPIDACNDGLVPVEPVEPLNPVDTLASYTAKPAYLALETPEQLRQALERGLEIQFTAHADDYQAALDCSGWVKSRLNDAPHLANCYFPLNGDRLRAVLPPGGAP